MIARLLATAAATLILARPAVGAAAPNPDSLRSLLPDPVQTGWIEAPPGTLGYLDGPIDAATLRNYYEFYRQDESWIQTQIMTLEQGGYVEGYERQWYRPHTQDLLSELVMVFATPKGASSAFNSFKIQSEQQSMFTSSFDPQLDSTGYGALAGTASYHFAAVSFEKGNAMYTAGVGAVRVLTADDALPQGRALYSGAPSSIQVPRPAALQPSAPRSFWLIAIAGLWVLVASAFIAVVLVIVLFAPRRRTTPPPSSETGQ